MNPSRKVTQLGREREGEREGGRERGREREGEREGGEVRGRRGWSRELVAEKRVVQEEKEFEMMTQKRREERRWWTRFDVLCTGGDWSALAFDFIDYVLQGYMTSPTHALNVPGTRRRL